MLRLPILLALGFVGLLAAGGRAVDARETDTVAPPPDSFFEFVSEPHREKARDFYRKYLVVHGMPVVAAEVVDDSALHRTQEIVHRMLAGRPDIVEALTKNEMYLVIIGKDQVYTDMPEYSDHPDPEFMNERVRGTGGRPTSFGEENLLSLPLDRYDDESIAVHEFCHTIDGALRSIDPEWRARLRATYQNAIDKNLYRNSYAASNPGEYWAEIAQAYFDCNRMNNWNHGPVGTREQLKVHDPLGYELVRATFNLTPNQDWRYSYLQPLPNVITPPESFEIDPYYEKFTSAREFVVLGKNASDAALLKANETIRKMFAYRHDILKALMADGLRLVVLGPDESLADLPEFQAAEPRSVDLLARFHDGTGGIKLLVVGEENLLNEPDTPGIGSSQVIRVFARALHNVAGTRPIDPNWETRGRNVQQYELRVKRLDTQFDERLQALHAEALVSGKWQGTPAVHDRGEYWAQGVLAYFDAVGQTPAPQNTPFPISTRELLETYDSGLYRLVAETMAYEGRVDWRYQPRHP